MRNINTALSLMASAARTASVNTAAAEGDQINDYHRGVVVTIDCTADPASASVTFTLQGKDQVSGKYYDILASAAITGTGTSRLVVYPGIAAVNNASANTVLPRIWRVKAVAVDGDSMTYSVGADLLV